MVTEALALFAALQSEYRYSAAGTVAEWRSSVHLLMSLHTAPLDTGLPQVVEATQVKHDAQPDSWRNAVHAAYIDRLMGSGRAWVLPLVLP